jgi:predicted nucleic acid-binding protein
MPGSVFFDTNVLLYAVAQDDPRGPRAEALLAGGGILSVQVLNEFVSVARRKMKMPWKNVNEALDAVRVLCPSAVPLTTATHQAALKIAERQGYSIYDALIVAAALAAGCATLYSEDLQDGQVFGGKLTIRNPFR